MYGRMTLSHTFGAGDSVWLRKAVSGVNISTSRLTKPTTTENIDQRLGVVLDGTAIFVELGRAFIWFDYA
jgi:hypothetical protein